jgi:hypothetical protein
MFDPLPLTQTTLETLLAEGGEYRQLDYKRRCDLSDKRELVEITKDLGAMQVYGGYIVIGADDQGKLTGDVTEAEAKLFDEARLRSKIARYVTGFDIRTAAFEIDGKHAVLICVRPHPDGWATFTEDGIYQDNKGVDKFVFRKGDVFVRNGSASERWSQADAKQIREEIRRQERETAKEQLRDEFAALRASGDAARAAATAPIGTLSLDLDPGTLNAAIVELIRAGDLIPLTLFFKQVPASVGELIKNGDSDVDSALDRLIGIAATLSTIERIDELRRVIDALGAIYNATFDQNGLDRGDLGIAPDDVRFRIVTRVFALGALLVRNEQWGAVRDAAIVRPRHYQADYWQNWLLHGDVMAARAGFHNHEEPKPGYEPYKSTIVFAQEHIVRLPELRPDLGPDDEDVVTSLCRFSMLACFAALSDPEGRRTGACLAHFSRWYATRTDPVVVELIAGGPMRDAIFPGSDGELADAVRTVALRAREMTHPLHGWHGFEDQRIHAFLEEHPEPQPVA